MNLKERIELVNQNKITSSFNDFEIKEDIEVSSFFVKNAPVEQILKSAITKDRNIVILSPSTVDRTLVSNYIRGFISKSVSIEILKNISDNLPYATADKLIIPEPSVAEIIKIFELIMCDFKTFIVSMHLKSFDNILESFRTIFALNNKNLTADNIEHLLGMAAPVIVYVDRNEDGLFYVADIAKVVYKSNSAFLDILYSTAKEEFHTVELLEEQAENTVDESVIEKTVEQEMFIEQEVSIVNEQKIEQEPVSILPEKINKYKLLKEKIRNKKQ